MFSLQPMMHCLLKKLLNSFVLRTKQIPQVWAAHWIKAVVLKPLHEVPPSTAHLTQPLQVFQFPLIRWIRCDRRGRHKKCAGQGCLQDRFENHWFNSMKLIPEINFSTHLQFCSFITAAQYSFFWENKLYCAVCTIAESWWYSLIVIFALI